ncbi:DUF6766 family protein [Thermomonospora cellulosilytica]|uniref:Glycerol uptake facilitator-like aquaporin n=1 Tax=Thermomonospora cellulosilytica TaxID=1411118 RepID=A0A7W3R951_9ACTN|nr:DUF6766 family protein [Thermomonospora cellulosilytica]MBA9004978.1 glycerol uptake facilitator-like aquaporin [Thermomonospora cellulosilytica]
MGFVRRNSLTLCFLLLMAGALAGQALAGLADYNERQTAEGASAASLGEYVTSAAYAVDVAENWQSEYLQFFLFIFLTVWLVQHGSPESKEPHKAGTESDEDQQVGRYAGEGSPEWARAGGLRGMLFSRSLGLVMGAFFLLSWGAQSVAGWAAYNSDRFARYEDAVSWGGYLAAPDFWSRTFQNWQSEFLAVASMVALSIYLRQRGSPESKPVGAPHGATGVEG